MRLFIVDRLCIVGLVNDNRGRARLLNIVAVEHLF